MDFYIIRCSDGKFRIGTGPIRGWSALNQGQVLTMLNDTYMLFDGRPVDNCFETVELALVAVHQLQGGT